MKTILHWILKHKIYSLLIVAVLIFGGRYGYQKLFVKATTVRYVTAKAQTGALTTSISGTGQVSASNQIDLKTKASGDIVYVGGKVGQEVKSGTLLVSLNATDALKSVRDAETALETAKLELDKLMEPADALTVFQSESALSQAQETKQKAEDALPKAYEDGFNAASNAFLDLPSVVTGLQDILLGTNYGQSSNVEYYANLATSLDRDDDVKIWNYKTSVTNSFNAAKDKYDKNFTDYKSTSRNSDPAIIEALLSETYDTTKLIADAVKNADNYLDFIQNILTEHRVSTPATMTTHQNSLEIYTGTANSNLSNLLSIRQTIKDSKAAITTADRAIEEKTLSLAKTKAAPDELDIRAKKIAIQQKQDALQSARENLADYSVRAPFNGVLASFTAKKSDSLSSGASVGTLITKQKIATIALNEVDVAKVKVGQKATITFDAIDDLNITGEVMEVDTLGTTSQGVVSYSVKIGFDVQDDRVKPGMTVGVNIILNTKPDVLMVSNSAVKTQNNKSYVQVLVSGAPRRKIVTVGDTNGSMTEITGGLTDGEEIITQTVTSGSTPNSSQSNSSKSSNREGPQGGMMFLH